MDSQNRQYFIKIVELLRRYERAAVEDSHSRAAFLHAIEEVLPGAQAAYTKHYERTAKAFSGSQQIAQIDQIIEALKNET
jgi:hypothetical protein